jgi:peroxiredoxin
MGSEAAWKPARSGVAWAPNHPRSDAVRADVKVGSVFPDYELPDHTGAPRRLSEIQHDDPMVIVLAREAYSAKDQLQHEGLVQLWREIKPGVGYCRMVTITTTDPQEALNYRNGVSAEWPFLADPGRVVQHDLDIAEYTDPQHDQMVPHTIVCEPGLVI